MRVFAFLTLVGHLLVVGPALAQAKDEKSGEALYRQGLEALEANHWDEACGLFTASLSRARRPSVLVRLGDCHLNAKDFVEAWKTLQDARALNNETPSTRRPELDDEIASLLAKVPTLQVSLLNRPAEAVVNVDGRPLTFDEVGVALPVEFGEHTVVATAPGFGRVETALKVSRQQAHMLALTLRPLSQTPATSAPAAPETPAPAPRPAPPPRALDNSDRRTAAYVVSAAGIVTLGAAAALGVMTLLRVSDSNSHCQYADGSCDSTGVNLRNEASRLQTAGLIVGGVGLVALSTGVALLVTIPSVERSGRLSLPSLTPRGVAVEVTWF